MTIDVVLTQTHPKLGQPGQVVKVSRGYARNFLIPHGMAKLATPVNLKNLEERKARQSKKEEERLANIRDLANKISETSLTMEVMAGHEDKLYGAVTTQDIQNGLSHHGVSVDKKDITLAEPIRKLGAYQIDVKLDPQVSAKLKLWVVQKKQ